MNFWLSAYPWIKAIHLMAVISWMAGIFYLPRLFVYHVERAQDDLDREDIFQTMERKLIRGIMNPAMIITWICGLLMIWIGGSALYLQPWFIIKFIMVCGMTGFHHWASLQRKALLRRDFKHDGKYYRRMNEIPTVLMVVIVVMVIVQPF